MFFILCCLKHLDTLHIFRMIFLMANHSCTNIHNFSSYIWNSRKKYMYILDIKETPKHTRHQTGYWLLLLLLILFDFRYMGILRPCVSYAPHLCSANRGHKKADFLELELHKVVTSIWALGIKPCSSLRTASIFNHGTISSPPVVCF